MVVVVLGAGGLGRSLDCTVCDRVLKVASTGGPTKSSSPKISSSSTDGASLGLAM